METLLYFVPNLSGPATNQTRFAVDDDKGQTDYVDDHFGEADLKQNDGDSGCCRAPDALILEEKVNAEFLIGLDGSYDDDAIGGLAAFRRAGYEQGVARFSQRRASVLPKLKVDSRRLALLPAYFEGRRKFRRCCIAFPISRTCDKPNPLRG